MKEGYSHLRKKLQVASREAFFGENRVVFYKMIDDILSVAEDENLSEDVIIERVEAAGGLLAGLHEVLSPRGKNDKEPDPKILCQDIDYFGSGLRPWDKDTYQSVDIEELNKIILAYISYDWLQSPWFEQYLLKAYLGWCVGSNRKKYLRSPLIGIANWIAVKFARIDLSLYYLIFLPLAAISTIVLFGIPLLMISMGGFLPIIFGALFLILVSIGIPVGLIGERRDLNKLIRLKHYISGKIWSPSFAVKYAEKISEIYMMHELIPLLSKIQSRNENAFLIPDSGYTYETIGLDIYEDEVSEASQF